MAITLAVWADAAADLPEAWAEVRVLAVLALAALTEPAAALVELAASAAEAAAKTASFGGMTP